MDVHHHDDHFLVSLWTWRSGTGRPSLPCSASGLSPEGQIFSLTFVVKSSRFDDVFSQIKVWSADKEGENCAPHNRNQGPTRRRWNALCRWGLMWMNISREGHYWRWINKTWSWMLHHKIKEFLISQTILFGINGLSSSLSSSTWDACHSVTIVEGRDDVGPVGIGAVLLSKEYVARKKFKFWQKKHRPWASCREFWPPRSWGRIGRSKRGCTGRVVGTQEGLSPGHRGDNHEGDDDDDDLRHLRRHHDDHHLRGLRSSTDGDSGSLAAEAVLRKAGVVPEIWRSWSWSRSGWWWGDDYHHLHHEHHHPPHDDKTDHVCPWIRAEANVFSQTPPFAAGHFHPIPSSPDADDRHDYDFHDFNDFHDVVFDYCPVKCHRLLMTMMMKTINDDDEYHN